uniref:Beta-fructofuranosidase n=1 Tax=Rhizopus microsporus TaxID=58291 RepID=A0A451FDG1_RHIZD|nr:beta-fructofuranosidase [Rhizopus microsporus]
MIQFKLIYIFTLIQYVLANKAPDINSITNRPLIHYTPEKGWMNDPNGLFYDKKDKIWHLYFQYNPNDTVWDLPLYWGHATSKDFVNWEHHDVAISPKNNNEGIYSGSIVIDYNNTTGFFNKSIDPNQRIVAIYTNNIPNLETQDIAYSIDGGYTFIKYENNPVINVNSSQFRDPKVFWHEETNQWIMVVSKSQEYKIQIFGSTNLKNWKLHSNFTSGYYGYQYECPGLIKVPIEKSSEYKWVMFLAINPGSPIGGSANQYFIGDFDGYKFKVYDNQTRFMDLGKDFYAFQTFSDVDIQNHGVLGLAWASNWQYANRVPDTDNYRSSMSLVRNYTLAYVPNNPETKLLTLIQKPVLGNSLKISSTINKKDIVMNTTTFIELKSNSINDIFDFDITFKVINPSVSHKNNSNFDIIIGSPKNENIKLGFDPVAQAFYVDRGIPNNKFYKNPFFTDKLSTYLEPFSYDENNYGSYQVYGLIDRNIIELYFNNGSTTMTNTFFMSKGNLPNSIKILTSIDDVFKIEDANIRILSL